jgi:2-amino-4-hydroxy-6-hydroxymethyldihydropteridine diphosphokinase
MTRAFIALGSNIKPEYNMQELPSARCRLLAVSPVYETAPVGKTDQPNFLNAAALIETDLTAAELKTQMLRVIEQELGRRAPGARTEEVNAWSRTRAHH